MYIHASQARTDRRGKPLLFSITEAVALILVAAALIAPAAVPAVIRPPRVARAQAVPLVGGRR